MLRKHLLERIEYSTPKVEPLGMLRKQRVLMETALSRTGVTKYLQNKVFYISQNAI